MADTPSFTWALIGMLLIGMFAGIFGIMGSKMQVHYPVTIDNGSLDSYNKMTAIQDTTNEIKNDVTTLKPDANPLDVIGAFFSNAYRVLVKIPTQLMTSVISLLNTAYHDLGLGEGGEIIFNTLIIGFTIIVFIGIILAILLKTNVI